MANRLVNLAQAAPIAHHARVLAVVETLKVSKQVWGELLIDFQEDVFKVRHGNAVRSDIELLEPRVKHLEEGAKVLSLAFVNYI